MKASTGPSRLVDECDPGAPSKSPSSKGDESGVSGARGKGGRSGPKRILIVDDSAEIRDFIAKLVSREGFVADTAQDGEEGWRLVCSIGYELVITDHQMPKLTGLSLIKRLREVSIKAPCILISASLPDPMLTLTKMIDPGAVLTKPFRAAHLIETVHSLLQCATAQGTREV